MSQFMSNRLPYDEPATPHEMAVDCRVVGAHLRIPRAHHTAAPVIHQDRSATTWKVSDSAARFADGFHLHLD